MARWARVLGLALAMALALGAGAGMAAAAPSRGGTLVEGMQEEPETLDPHVTNRFHSYQVLSHMVEPLFTLDKQFNVVPLLAESYRWSADKLTLELHLKKGIKFHNGQEMTAEDVKASYERYFRMSPLATYMPEKAGGVYAIDTPDRYTVVLRFKTPKPLAMYELADAHMSIMPAAWLRDTPKEDIGIRALVGTGPMKFVQWVPGDRIEMARFDEYRHGPEFVSNRGPAWLDRYVIRIIPEASTRVAELTSGTVDISYDVLPHAVPSLQQNPAIRVETAPSYSIQYLAMNARRPVFQDQRVRQAIAHAISKDAISRAAWQGLGRPIDSLLSPSAIGYWEGAKNVAYAYDPKRAAQLLDEAGWKVGPGGLRQKDGQPMRLTLLTFSNLDQWKRAGEIVQGQLRQLGIEVRLETAEVGAAYDRAEIGDFDIGIFRNTWWLGHPFLQFLAHSRNIGSSNFGFWVNSELDRNLERSMDALDPEVSRNSLNEAQRIIVESAVWVPLVYNPNILAAKSTVGGIDELVTHKWWPPTMRMLVLYRAK